MTDDAEGGIARMRDHMSELKVTGSEYISDRYLTFIANALGGLGRFDEGLRVVDESFPFIERSGQRYYEAELHRLKGEMLLALDTSNAAQAEQSLRTAIDISRKQHAKSWSCARSQVSRACWRSSTNAKRRGRCSPKSTTGSPKASTHRT